MRHLREKLMELGSLVMASLHPTKDCVKEWCRRGDSNPHTLAGT